LIAKKHQYGRCSDMDFTLSRKFQYSRDVVAYVARHYIDLCALFEQRTCIIEFEDYFMFAVHTMMMTPDEGHEELASILRERDHDLLQQDRHFYIMVVLNFCLHYYGRKFVFKPIWPWAYM